jgi:hypothetical protein
VNRITKQLIGQPVVFLGFNDGGLITATVTNVRRGIVSFTHRITGKPETFSGCMECRLMTQRMAMAAEVIDAVERRQAAGGAL